MPRGPRKDHAIADYKYSRAYDSYLPLRHGKTFDIYVDTDTTAEMVFKREIRDGLTPGMLRKVNEAFQAEWQLKHNLRQELKDQGIMWDFREKEYVGEEEYIRRCEEEYGFSAHAINRLRSN